MSASQLSAKPVIGIMTSVIDHRKARGTALVGLRFLEGLDAYTDRFSFYFIHHDTYDHPLYKKYPEVLIPKLPGVLNKQLLNELWFWVFVAPRLSVRFDIVHYLHPRVWPSFLFTRARAIVVSGFEGAHMLPVNQHAGDNKLFWFTSRFLHWRMNAITACSLSGRKEIIESYPVSASKVRCIYLGVDAHYHPTKNKAIAQQKLLEVYGISSPYLLAVSRFDPHKNILGILDAYEQFTEHYRGVPLVLVGGPHTEGYSQTCEARIARMNAKGLRVHVIPFVEDGDMPLLYANSKMLVYPSLHEGFGLPALEALACETPVITSHSSSLPEVVADAALLVDPHDTKAIAKAMVEIYENDSLRRSLIIKGRVQSARFSWKKMVAETIALYEEVVRGGI